MPSPQKNEWKHEDRPNGCPAPPHSVMPRLHVAGAVDKTRMEEQEPSNHTSVCVARVRHGDVHGRVHHAAGVSGGERAASETTPDILICAPFELALKS